MIFEDDWIQYDQRCSSKKHGFHTFREQNSFHRYPYVLIDDFGIYMFPTKLSSKRPDL